MIIYKTTNTINGKIYVGLDTKNNPNYLGSGKIFKLAVKKYGKENFKKEIIIESLSISIEEAKEIEVFWINELNATSSDIGYNIRNSVVYSNYGIKQSDEFKKKLSELNKGEKNRMYGKHHSEETKRKLREKCSGKNSPMFGKHLSEETKQKISKQKKGVPISEKARKNMRANDGKNNPMYGKHHSEESKKKNSESHKGKKSWNKGKKNIYSKEIIQKMSDANKGKMWIHNLEAQKTKRVTKEEIESYITQGWKVGRL